MTREEIVTVQVQGGGAASFAAGEKYALALGAGKPADRWANGQPITRAEFEAVLESEGIFEIVPPRPVGALPRNVGAKE